MSATGGGVAAKSADTRPADPILALPAAERLKVHEIFHSIQGESTYAGRRCVLVRLTGCQMRCVWCDTPYAFYKGEWMSRAQVLERVASFGCPLVELTGGEPLLQPGALPLMRELCDAGYEVLLETGGGVDISGVDPRVVRIVDVKCPGSGEAQNNHWPNLDHLAPHDELKFVLADEDDYRWARRLVLERALHERARAVHFSPVHGACDPQVLAGWLLRDQLPVRLQLQAHKYIWSPEARGV
ncbi:MAG: 7-carboxy-7-deazaguanine synthase QueE [Holophagales bacterium]|nr:7-carboxy-7-deazaguanine synthase QueE [Holophagales bacterium]